jgi:hypothetical protein
MKYEKLLAQSSQRTQRGERFPLQHDRSAMGTREQKAGEAE